MGPKILSCQRKFINTNSIRKTNEARLPINNNNTGSNLPTKGGPEAQVWGVPCPEGICDPSRCDCDSLFKAPPTKGGPKWSPQAGTPQVWGVPCPEGTCDPTRCDCDSLFKAPTQFELAFDETPQRHSSLLGTASLPACPKGKCSSHCECSMDSMVALLNPGTSLASMPRVCATGECSTDCICRDDLAKAARLVITLREHRYDSSVPANLSSLTLSIALNLSRSLIRKFSQARASYKFRHNVLRSWRRNTLKRV